MMPRSLKLDFIQFIFLQLAFLFLCGFLFHLEAQSFQLGKSRFVAANNLGSVIGYGEGNSSASMNRPFYLPAGRFQVNGDYTFDTTQAQYLSFERATGINDADTVVGFTYATASPYRWRAGDPMPQPFATFGKTFTTGGSFTQAHADGINNSDFVIGRALAGRIYSWWWEPIYWGPGPTYRPYYLARFYGERAVVMSNVIGPRVAGDLVSPTLEGKFIIAGTHSIYRTPTAGVTECKVWVINPNAPVNLPQYQVLPVSTAHYNANLHCDVRAANERGQVFGFLFERHGQATTRIPYVWQMAASPTNPNQWAWKGYPITTTQSEFQGKNIEILGANTLGIAVGRLIQADGVDRAIKYVDGLGYSYIESDDAPGSGSTPTIAFARAVFVTDGGFKGAVHYPGGLIGTNAHDLSGTTRTTARVAVTQQKYSGAVNFCANPANATSRHCNGNPTVALNAPSRCNTTNILQANDRNSSDWYVGSKFPAPDGRDAYACPPVSGAAIRLSAASGDTGSEAFSVNNFGFSVGWSGPKGNHTAQGQAILWDVRNPTIPLPLGVLRGIDSNGVLQNGAYARLHDINDACIGRNCVANTCTGPACFPAVGSADFIVGLLGSLNPLAWNVTQTTAAIYDPSLSDVSIYGAQYSLPPDSPYLLAEALEVTPANHVICSAYEMPDFTPVIVELMPAEALPGNVQL